MVTYNFWSGEYPKPVIYIQPTANGWARIRGYESLRNPGRKEVCTVKTGLYHPWSKDNTSLINYYTIIPKVTYVARQNTTLNNRRIKKGDILDNEFYLAEGDCSYLLNKKKKITTFCLGDAAEFQRIEKPAHPSEQWLYIKCREGYNVFVRDTDLLRQLGVKKGVIKGYGKVAPPRGSRESYQNQRDFSSPHNMKGTFANRIAANANSKRVKPTPKTKKADLSALQQAYNAYQQAFERYTAMVTSSSHSDPASVQKALETYRNSYARYKQLKEAQRNVSREPEKRAKRGSELDTSGLNGIANAAPSDAKNKRGYADSSGKDSLPHKSKDSRKNIAETRQNVIMADKYHYGIGVKPDQYKAFELYKDAAKKGDVNAMVELSGFYEQGVWIKQSHSIAKQLLQKSADKGSLIAKWQLELINERQ